MDISNLLVSIIIPLYNAELYVDDIVQNINSQTYKNLEVVFVDDGSTDCTLELIKTKIIKVNNVVYLRQVNKGPSAARNKGIDNATGDYIVFWDADDYVDPECIFELVKNIGYDELRMTSISKRYFENNRVWDEKEGIIFPQNSNHLNEIFSDILCSNHIYIITVCNKIYSRNIIQNNNLRFSEDIVWAEDLSWNINYLKYIKVISLVEKCTYFYSIRKKVASLSKTYKRQNILSLYQIYNEMLWLIESGNFYDKEKCYMWCIDNALSNCANIFGKDSFIENIKFLKQECFFEFDCWAKKAKSQNYFDLVILNSISKNRYNVLGVIIYLIYIFRKFHVISKIKKLMIKN